MAKKTDVFGGLDPSIYKTSLSGELFSSLKEVRAEYSRLAKAARKRIKRLEAAGFGESDIYLRYKDVANPLEKMSGKDGELERSRKALWDVAYFLSLKTSSVSGQKNRVKEFIKSMADKYYKEDDEGNKTPYINKSNAEAFGRFMGSVTEYFGSRKAYDSEEYVELYHDMEEKHAAGKGEIFDTYEAWLEAKKG